MQEPVDFGLANADAGELCRASPPSAPTSPTPRSGPRRSFPLPTAPPCVDFPLPDSLTTWKVKTWTLGPGTKVGQAESEIVTSKDLLVRLQAPRFFVEKDEVVLSANVHNKLKTAKSVQVVLELDGSVLQPLGCKLAAPCRSPPARSTASTSA